MNLKSSRKGENISDTLFLFSAFVKRYRQPWRLGGWFGVQVEIEIE